MKKTPIRILDTAFNLLGEIDNYESLQFTRRWQRAGEFELHIALSKDHTDKLLEDRVIYLVNQPHKAGYIQYREIHDENGAETLVVKGVTLAGIFDRRVTVTDTYDRVIGPAETVAKHYLNNHMVSSPYPERNVPFFVLAPDQGRGMSTPWQSRFEQLNDVISEIARYCDIGFQVALDFAVKKWRFDVDVGRDLTVNQGVLPPVIFSHDFDNIESQLLIESGLNFKNVGYAGGKGEEEDRVIQIVGSSSGFDRREVFIDASSAEDTDELVALGSQKLSEYSRIVTYDGKVLDTHSFQYERDWDLGDKVTLRNKRWGLAADARITEVKEIYEQNPKIEVLFGDALPTITKMVKDLQNKVKRSG